MRTKKKAYKPFKNRDDALAESRRVTTNPSVVALAPEGPWLAVGDDYVSITGKRGTYLYDSTGREVSAFFEPAEEQQRLPDHYRCSACEKWKAWSNGVWKVWDETDTSEEAEKVMICGGCSSAMRRASIKGVRQYLETVPKKAD